MAEHYIIVVLEKSCTHDLVNYSHIRQNCTFKPGKTRDEAAGIFYFADKNW